MASSDMELQLGVFGFCWPHTRKQTWTKCGRDLRAPCGILRVFIFMLRSQYTRTWQNHGYFDRGKTWIPPIGAPCRNKDGTGSGISGAYLWSILKIVSSSLNTLAASPSLVFMLSALQYAPHALNAPTLVIYSLHHQEVQLYLYQSARVNFIPPYWMDVMS